LEHAVAVAALIQGTRDVSLKMALILDEPENLTDLITRAHRYAHCNEVLLSIRDHDDPRGQDKPRKAGREPERRKKASTRRGDDFDSRSRDKRPRVAERYTSLNLTPSHVLMEIRGKEYLRWHRPLHSDPRSRDRNKYCQFHWDHDHDTNDCRELKNE